MSISVAASRDAKTDSLFNLRCAFAKVTLGLIAFNFMVTIVTVVLLDSDLAANFSLSAALSACGVYFVIKNRTSPITRYITAAVIAGQVAVIVNAAGGTQFQIDTHMYFFAMLAFLAGWCDWRAIVVYSAVVAIHHLGLNFIYPAAVFPNGSDFLRVVLHAVIVVVEAGFLIWMTSCLAKAMQSADTASGEAYQQKDTADKKTADIEKMIASLTARETKVKELINEYNDEITLAYDEVQQTVAELNKMSGDLSDIAQDATSKMQDAASLTAESNQNVSSVASASEELSHSINEINSRGEQAKNTASESAKAIGGTSEAVSKLAESARKIDEVISLIQDIAEQTNLLALNATIEAARAGEMGKGFAVVAAEVKALAAQTAKATDEISGQVANIQMSTEGTVKEIESIVDLIDNMDQLTLSISTAIVQQGAATSEISENAQASEKITRFMADNIQTVQNGVERTNEIASSVRSISEKVAVLNDRINDLTHNFLTGIAELNNDRAA